MLYLTVFAALAAVRADLAAAGLRAAGGDRRAVGVARGPPGRHRAGGARRRRRLSRADPDVDQQRQPRDAVQLLRAAQRRHLRASPGSRRGACSTCLGFLFTFVIGTIWGVTRYRPENFATTEPFLILFFLFYVGIAVLYALRQSLTVRNYVDATLVFGTPLVAAGLQSGLVRDMRYGMALSALAMSARLPGAGARALHAQRSEDLRLLVEAFLALGVDLRDAGDSARARRALDVGDVGARRRGDAVGRRAPAPARGARLRPAAATRRRHRVRVGLLAVERHRPERLWPLVNSDFVGAVLVGLAGLFSAWLMQRARSTQSSLRSGEELLARAAVRVGNAVVAVRGLARNRALAAVRDAHSGAGRAARAHRGRVRAGRPARLVAGGARPADAAAARPAADRARRHRRHGLPRLGMACRRASVRRRRLPRVAAGARRRACGCCRLRDRDGPPGLAMPEIPPDFWHAMLLWLVTLLCAHELAWVGTRVGSGAGVWTLVPWGLVPALAHRAGDACLRRGRRGPVRRARPRLSVVGGVAGRRRARAVVAVRQRRRATATRCRCRTCRCSIRSTSRRRWCCARWRCGGCARVK